MTIEQAQSELMQIYGALSPNKQIAIDTLVKASVKPQEPKSEWEHDHEILKTYSDGANDVLDKYKAEEAEAHPVNENIAKGFEEFTKMMFKQGQAKREEE